MPWTPKVIVAAREEPGGCGGGGGGRAMFTSAPGVTTVKLRLPFTPGSEASSAVVVDRAPLDRLLMTAM